MNRKLTLVALLASSVMGLVHADAVEEGIAKYREMLQDGNPAELFEMNGEELWTTARGPKNATMEKCDLGKGTGVHQLQPHPTKQLLFFPPPQLE